MGQGSSVTYSAQSCRYQPPSFFAALRRASISACAVGSPRSSAPVAASCDDFPVLHHDRAHGHVAGKGGPASLQQGGAHEFFLVAYGVRFHGRFRSLAVRCPLLYPFHSVLKGIKTVCRRNLPGWVWKKAVRKAERKG